MEDIRYTQVKSILRSAKFRKLEEVDQISTLKKIQSLGISNEEMVMLINQIRAEEEQAKHQPQPMQLSLASIATIAKTNSPIRYVQKPNARAARPTTVNKRKKDPNQPKRPITGYMAYGSIRRPQLKATRPDLGFGDLTNVIADEWNSMNDFEKAPYLDMANGDRYRYEQEMTIYNAKH